MKRLLIVSLVLLTTLMTYGLYLAFSEDREYGRASIDYVFLTPAVLKSLPIQTQDARYFYSAADGNKPMTSRLRFSSLLPPATLRRALTAHLLARGYKKTGPDRYDQGLDNLELFISQEQGSSVVELVLLEALD